MFESVGTLVVGAIFGLALAAPPGPMNAIIAEESVLRGWVPGFTAGLGAFTADALFFVLTLVGVVTVIDAQPAIRPLLYLFGGLLMCYFAIDAFRSARKAFASRIEDDAGAAAGFKKTFVLAATNPYQIGFWVTVGVGLLKEGTLDVFSHVPLVGTDLAGTLVVETGSPTLLIGFFGGIVVWIVVFPATLVEVGDRVDELAPVIATLSGVVLAGFGALFLGLGASGLL
ncbi:LysE family translocator [Halovivax limisalsi]|uniref:LysE family translocator n=1 Tax=Halovivax limisalsi TaxID=1453760 RepID=UPI001FFC82A2|nr:LysE family transporter [Halovivax limisalsi]